MDTHSETFHPRSYQAGIRAWLLALAGALATLVFLAVPVLPAVAQDTPNVEAGDGTVRVGEDVFAGDGCARAGDVAAGDCGEGSRSGGEKNNGESTEEQPQNGSEKTGPDGESTPDEGTSASSTTGPVIPGTDATTAETTATEPTGVTGARTNGTTFTGSTEGTAECPVAPPEDAPVATVRRAIDGDTLELQEPVDGYDTVRLIGVDTPEMDGGEDGPDPGAEQAKEYTAEALEGEEIILETDEEIEDPYGRLLAYAWLQPEDEDPELFNRALVAEGYAELLTVEPNDAYAECLAAAEAKDAGSDIREESPQGKGGGNEGLIGRIRDLISSDSEPSDNDETPGAGDQYTTAESPEMPATEATSDGTTGDTTEAAAGGLTGSNSGTEDLAAIPPENCPGASVALETFGGAVDAQSPPFEITGGSFVVRADLRGEDPTAASLDVAVLDTRSQEPVEEFDQRSVGSYDALISQGPGSYTLDLQPESGSYEVTIFDCADEETVPTTGREKPEQTVPGASRQDSEVRPGSSAPAESEYEDSGSDNEPAAEEPARVELPADSPPQGLAREAEPSAATLPTRDTPSGEEEVLPDTGGLSAPLLICGLLLVCTGASGLLYRRLARHG